jgi:hypothetical protein
VARCHSSLRLCARLCPHGVSAPSAGRESARFLARGRHDRRAGGQYGQDPGRFRVVIVPIQPLPGARLTA